MIGFTTGFITGMMSAAAGSLLLGCGSLFFVVGASFGFAGGVWKFYTHSILQATVALEEFPALMLLHLDASFPLYRWRRRSLSERMGWTEKSMLVTAWSNAGAAIEVRCVLTGGEINCLLYFGHSMVW